MSIYSPTTAAEMIHRSIADAGPVSIHMSAGAQLQQIELDLQKAANDYSRPRAHVGPEILEIDRRSYGASVVALRRYMGARPASHEPRTGLCDKWDTWTVTIVEMD